MLAIQVLIRNGAKINVTVDLFVICLTFALTYNLYNPQRNNALDPLYDTLSKFDLTASNRYGRNFLHVAPPETLKYLIAKVEKEFKHIDINAMLEQKDKYGRTPLLHQVAYGSTPEGVVTLLDRKANIQAVDKKNEHNCLHLATEHTLPPLLKYGAISLLQNTNTKAGHPLAHHVLAGHAPMVQALLPLLEFPRDLLILILCLKLAVVEGAEFVIFDSLYKFVSSQQGSDVNTLFSKHSDRPLLCSLDLATLDSKSPLYATKKSNKTKIAVKLLDEGTDLKDLNEQDVIDYQLNSVFLAYLANLASIIKETIWRKGKKQQYQDKPRQNGKRWLPNTLEYIANKIEKHSAKQAGNNNPAPTEISAFTLFMSLCKRMQGIKNSGKRDPYAQKIMDALRNNSCKLFVKVNADAFVRRCSDEYKAEQAKRGSAEQANMAKDAKDNVDPFLTAQYENSGNAQRDETELPLRRSSVSSASNAAAAASAGEACAAHATAAAAATDNAAVGAAAAPAVASAAAGANIRISAAPLAASAAATGDAVVVHVGNTGENTGNGHSMTMTR